MLTDILLMTIPGYKGGYLELFNEIFFGASEIKGGIVALVLRVIPRVALLSDNKYRYLMEVILTFPFIMGSYALIKKIYKKNINQNENRNNISGYLFWELFFGLFILSFGSLFYIKFPEILTTYIYKIGLTSISFFMWQILYIFVFMLIAYPLLIGIQSKEYLSSQNRFWDNFVLLLAILGIVASGRHNITFGSAIFVPILISTYNINKKAINILIGSIFLWTLAWHIAPNWKSTFSNLNKLPDSSVFSGLYWPNSGAQIPGSYPLWNSSSVIGDMNSYFSNIREVNKTVLWLVPGPGAAFGGEIYRFGIHGISSNNVPASAEARLAESLKNVQPDIIVTSDLSEWSDPKWKIMNKDILLPWLNSYYTQSLVYNKTSPNIIIWEKN